MALNPLNVKDLRQNFVSADFSLNASSKSSLLITEQRRVWVREIQNIACVSEYGGISVQYARIRIVADCNAERACLMTQLRSRFAVRYVHTTANANRGSLSECGF
jgi:hypothetical protein